jgi:hypothetical protein
MTLIAGKPSRKMRALHSDTLNLLWNSNGGGFAETGIVLNNVGGILLNVLTARDPGQIAVINSAGSNCATPLEALYGANSLGAVCAQVAAVHGLSTGVGVEGDATGSSTFAAGLFNNIGGGNIVVGQNNGTNEFRVDGTKPGVLATRYEVADTTSTEQMKEDVPLAIVGIVPCKVSAENGAIHPGDLLVTSSRPGYAMRGSDRARMLGAVVGKAMQPLERGTGSIEVLVTLQ